jgi:reverse gyrase
MDEVEKGRKEFQKTLHEIYNEIKGGIKWKK